MTKNIYLLLLSLVLVSCGESSNTTPTGQTAEPQKVYKWRMVTTWPKNLPGLGTAPERMVDNIRTMSNGRLDIKVYGAGEIVPALEVFEAVSQGTVQMGHGASYYWKGKVPIAQFFTAVPFGLTAQEMNGWLLHGGGLELWRELYARYNLFPIPGGNTGVQMAGWFNKEINSLEDLRGLKMRIPGLGGEVFEAAGGTAVNLPGGEIFTSMQTGVIDATEWVGPYNDLAFGLHQVAKYYYYPGWQEAGPTLEVLVNKEAWDQLPDDLKAIVETASLAGNTDMLAEYTARNNMALQELVNEHQVELRRLPDDVLAELRSIAVEKTAAIVDDDELSKRIYDSWMQYRDDVIEYHEISERAYINARAN
ncbi:MAG: TRAP transporter substrate-binding protein [Gammaproteobacteria bacterium]|jgi:TRAP-type mannitol/chloroaromatic compound transport system substrate-binding protein|nr:TRAP transporter substrate-binding protein [Gammaproteobacteria bacterium]MBT4494574.1 TRAP transporter substrate-binding protein [Gammaproteobacteria bacterium]